MSWKLYQYQNVYNEFLASIAEDKDLLAIIEQRLDKLTELGNMAREPISKPIEDGIFECRARAKQRHARLLYCFQPEKQKVILLAILKDQNKLKRADIDKAKQRKLIIQANKELQSGSHKTHRPVHARRLDHPPSS